MIESEQPIDNLSQHKLDCRRNIAKLNQFRRYIYEGECKRMFFSLRRSRNTLTSNANLNTAAPLSDRNLRGRYRYEMHEVHRKAEGHIRRNSGVVHDQPRGKVESAASQGHRGSEGPEGRESFLNPPSSNSEIVSMSFYTVTKALCDNNSRAKDLLNKIELCFC